MNAALTFESDAGLPGETKPSPTSQAAWRFARQIVSQGFLPRRHFIDRIAERALGGGVRFDPRTFRTEFYDAQHYRQTRPGYTTRIAVVRDVPILYRIGGRHGKRIVLTGALPPDSPLPPSERIARPASHQETPLEFESGSAEECTRCQNEAFRNWHACRLRCNDKYPPAEHPYLNKVCKAPCDAAYKARQTYCEQWVCRKWWPFSEVSEQSEAELAAEKHEDQQWQKETARLGEAKRSPTWQAAWRFARQIVSQGFLPRRHFIDRIAERALGGGVRFDPRTFRTEFYNAQHYRQTRPGYTIRIAVVRDVPILYRIGGRHGKHIVLTGALPPDSPLPPSEPIAAPPQREAELLLETETSEEEETRRRLGAGPRRRPPRRRPIRPGRRPIRPIYDGPRLTVDTSDGDGSGGGDGRGVGPDEVLRLLIRAKTAMSEAAFDERERGDRKRAERSVRFALEALRKVPATWRSATEGPLEEALNSLVRLNNAERFRTFLTRALSRIREAMEDRRSFLGR